MITIRAWGPGAEARGWRLGAILKDRRPDKSNNLVFFSFAMVPMYIYLENLENRLNTMRLALCLAMGSDRLIAKQGHSLLGLSLNWYVIMQIVYVYHFYQSQFTLFWDSFGEEACRCEKSPKFLTLWHLKKYIISVTGIWYPSCKHSSKMRLW